MSYCQLSAWPLGYECMELREAIRKGQISVKDAEKIVGSFVRRFNRELRKRGYEVVSHSSKQMLEYWGFGEPTMGLMAKAWLVEVIGEDVDCAELEREFENKLSEHIEKELPKYLEKHKKSIMFEGSIKMDRKIKIANELIEIAESLIKTESKKVLVPAGTSAWLQEKTKGIDVIKFENDTEVEVEELSDERGKYWYVSAKPASEYGFPDINVKFFVPKDKVKEI